MRSLITGFSSQVLISLIGCSMAYSQGRPLDWPSHGGDAQRTGWEKVDSRITKANVKDFQLVLKTKLENTVKGPRSLSPPVVIGLLISYRGFKELAFVAGSGDNMWAIDADMDRIFWHKQLAGTPSGTPGPCASDVIATPALVPPINFGVRPRPAPGGPRPAASSAAAAAPPPPSAPPAARSVLGGSGFGAPRPTFAISSDGKLHPMNTSTGDDVAPAIPYLPAGARASSLTVHEGTVYTTTATDCGASTGGVFAIDLNATEPKAQSFALNGGTVSRHGGLAIGTDGSIYVQTGPGPSDEASNKWSNTLLALTPKELKLKNYFTASGATETKSPLNLNVVTPVVFAYKGRDLIVSAGTDGSLYLLDSKAVGGDDHKTPMSKTAPLATSGGGVWGGLSSWADTDGTRWVLAPVWGSVNPALNAPANNGSATHGSVVAFKLEDKGEKTVLTPAWVSRDMNSPAPPVITSGVIFTLSAGEYGSDGRPNGSTHATLYALDAVTGKEMYSTGNQVTSPGNLTGVTIANGRVFFSTTDSTLWGFGVYMER